MIGWWLGRYIVGYDWVGRCGLVCCDVEEVDGWVVWYIV